MHRKDIDHTRTKAKSPQTNGICERFHRTVLDEFYQVAFRKKIYRTIDELQTDLDVWIEEYNERRPHQGRWCFDSVHGDGGNSARAGGGHRTGALRWICTAHQRAPRTR
jgi:hypothetical protein